MKKIALSGTVLMILLSCTGVVSANLVSNGGFDLQPGNIFDSTGSGLQGWTVETGNVDLIRSYESWADFEGVQSLDLSGSQRGTISQAIPTEQGKYYYLTFAMAGNPELGNTEKILEVYWNNNKVGTYKFTPSGWPGPSQWHIHEINGLKATSDSTTIRFKDATQVGDSRCGVMLSMLLQWIPTLHRQSRNSQRLRSR